MNPNPKSLAQVPLEARRSKVARAKDMLKAGYPVHLIEKRLHSGMERVRVWAAELGVKLEHN